MKKLFFVSLLFSFVISNLCFAGKAGYVKARLAELIENINNPEKVKEIVHEVSSTAEKEQWTGKK